MNCCSKANIIRNLFLSPGKAVQSFKFKLLFTEIGGNLEPILSESENGVEPTLAVKFKFSYSRHSTISI
jgi:hypothetical protein